MMIMKENVNTHANETKCEKMKSMNITNKKICETRLSFFYFIIETDKIKLKYSFF